MFDLYGGATFRLGAIVLHTNVFWLRRLIVATDIFLFLGIYVLFFVILRSKNKFIKTVFSSLSIGIILLLLAQAVLYIDMALIEPNWIKVERISLRIPRLAGILNGVKIVQFSDLHTNKFGFREKRLIKIINSLNPDIILFTGGFTGEDFKHIRSAINDAAKVFGALKANIGIWAVTDDTDDQLFKNRLYKSKIEDAGVRLLFNKNQRICINNKGCFWLIGAEDAFYGRNGLNEAMRGVLTEEPKILLTHSPNLIDSAVDAGIDLMLAGKTHGGQIGFDFLRKLVGYIASFKYIKGLYKEKDTYLYVNRGIGVKTSRYRFFCRPEVSVFNIVE